MKSFSEMLTEMKEYGITVPQPPRLRLPNAKPILENAIQELVSMQGRNPVWIPQYDEVSSWLEDNQGKGLFLYGSCGQGKSLIARTIIPTLFLNYHHKVVTVADIQRMNRDLDLLLQKRIITLDDIGTEEEKVEFGNRRMAFPELIDTAEKNGNILIITTNLASKDKIVERYGDRVFDRILSTTKRILFKGETLRK